MVWKSIGGRKDVEFALPERQVEQGRLGGHSARQWVAKPCGAQRNTLARSVGKFMSRSQALSLFRQLYRKTRQLPR